MNFRLMAPLAGRSLSRMSDNPFVSLQRELNRAFDDMWSGLPAAEATAASTALRLDVKEDDKAYHITTDLPGIAEKDVDVTFQDGILTIKGEKKVERDEKKDTWHIIERSSGSFARQLSLPANIDEDKIIAKFDKGVLTIMLPKMPEAQSKATKIEVKGG
ncbi:MAG: Hsp20/alpha crystallin family protein [Alphaproteobacteria bacterium]|nr:Hsp20/alpha crystallin family protein [Alphaproteobacteria bacterium]